MKKDHKLVWVGFSDGKPHVYACEEDGTGCVAVYNTRREARAKYQDVRRARLVIEPSTSGASHAE